MEDVSDIRGANGELKDCVAALHYVESGEAPAAAVLLGPPWGADWGADGALRCPPRSVFVGRGRGG